LQQRISTFGSWLAMPDPTDLDTAITPPRVIDATRRFKEVRRTNCRHGGQILYDPTMRTIECEACGAVLDAFDWIVHLAREESRILANYRSARAEWHRLEKANEELSRRERNAKARVRNWERKADLTEHGLPKIGLATKKAAGK